MYDVVRDIIGNNAIDDAVAYSTELVGKECIGCMRALPYSMFQADSSFRDGRRDLCQSCESSPRLSTAEHTDRLREQNFSSEGVKRQRMDHQDELRDEMARLGRQMHHSDLIHHLERLVPSLYITEGRIAGDLAVFRTYGVPQPQLDGRTFEYLFYIPTGVLPEFSLYEWDNLRDIAIREKKRGWRTVLLRLIKTGLLTEAEVNKHFGLATGPGSERYNRILWEHRNHI